jgi:hypothetical protein
MGIALHYTIFGPETASQRACCERQVPWWKTHSLDQSSGLFMCTTSCNRLSIGWLFGLVEWIQSEQYSLYRIKWWAVSSFVISTCYLTLNRLCHSKKTLFVTRCRNAHVLSVQLPHNWR